MSKTSRDTARKARDLPRKIAAGRDEEKVAARKKPAARKRARKGK
jgi:hypothetical protein